MTRIGIIAAGGESKRTGLGEYTTKAALPLRGKSLLGHQLDFLRRSGTTRAYVIARPEHVQLLERLLTSEDRAFTSFVLSDRPSGWAGEIERASTFIDDRDETILISCDNDHAKQTAISLVQEEAVFTFTEWTADQHASTNGPILARVTTAWGNPTTETWFERGSAGFLGAFFSGYAIVRGRLLLNTLRGLPAIDGKKEFTALLALLARHPLFRAVPYGGLYEDIRDLRALALLNAERSTWSEEHVDLGAGVLLHDNGEVLLTERQDGRGWTPPSGFVDTGETYAHAAVRELREEIGIGITERDLRLLGVYLSTGKQGGPACTVIFHARVGRPALTINAKEAQEARWVTSEEAEALVIPFGLDGSVRDAFAGRELDTRRRS